MANLEQLRQNLIEASNDSRMPHGVREDARLVLEGLAHLPQPAAPSGPQPAPAERTWMSAGVAEPTVQAELELAAAPAKITRDAMTALAGWIVDAGTTVERIHRAVLEGQPLLQALAVTMQGVRRGTPLGDQLHAEAQQLTQWFLDVRRQIVGDQP